MKRISILIPTYNEEENVIPLSVGILEEFKNNLPDYDYEIIFIDNNSIDNTQSVIRELCDSDPKIKAIFNVKNYGQFSSPYYGILQATGDCVISLCADFQDPVEMIPKFVKEWECGSKIVLGQKVSSKENRIIYALRGFYYRFMKKNSNAEFIEHVTGFGLYDREFIEIMRNIDESRPFIRGIIAEMGYKIKLIPYEQQNRKTGRSSNSILGYYDAAVQGITSYTKIGIRLAVFFGALFTIASILITVSTVVYKILNWDSFDIWPMVLDLIILTVVSIQLLFIGVVGEYILDINSRMKKRPLVIESERINF